MVFFKVFTVTHWFLIEILELEKENLRKILFFHLLIDQKVLAPLVKQQELFKDAMV